MNLVERLDQGPVLCAEGYLFEMEKRGYLQAGAFVPEVVLEHPDVVTQLHREFIRAGSDVVQAFTYYGHREKLRLIGKEDLLEPLQKNALKIAKDAANEFPELDLMIAGDVANTNIYDPSDSKSIVEVEKMYEEQIAWAKAIEFGLMYGMSAFGLGKQIGVGRNQAQDYIDLYFSKYPNVRSFMDKTKIKARENGFIETLFGRRLYLPDINSKNGLKRNYAERSAINAPMQGSAADIIKIAMIDVDQWIVSKKVPARIIMQVHDELVLEVKSDASDDIKFDLIKIMESSVDLDVPLVVDAAVGLNWDEAH